MDLRKIKKLIELLEESALSEMEISEGENTIRLSRAPRYAPGMAAPAVTAATGEPAIPSAAPLDSPPTESPAEPAAGPTAAANAAGSGSAGPAGHVVVSPLVGTFYDAPSPDAAPFVTVGAEVARGDTLCLIEAMKTFNHIDAEVAGTVAAVHKHSGAPVEYGEALFVIDAGADGDGDG